MIISYPSLTVDTPGVRRAVLALIDRGETCPLLIGSDGMACPCDGLYGLIEDIGEEAADRFEWSVLSRPVELGVVKTIDDIRLVIAVDDSTDDLMCSTYGVKP